MGWLVVVLFVCFGDSTSDSFTSFKITFLLFSAFLYKSYVVMHGHQFFHVDLVAVSSSFHLVFQNCLPTLLLLSHLFIFFPYLFWGTTFGRGVDVCFNAWVARKVILACREFAESHQNVHYRIVSDLKASIVWRYYPNFIFSEHLWL